MEHYWPVEACSTSHSGPQLEPNQFCNPNVNNIYCSYMGTCNSDGSMCLCNEHPHRYSSERCAIYHSDPQTTQAPSMVTTDVTVAPSPSAEACYTCMSSISVALLFDLLLTS